jgi:hypothetical protein
MRNRLMLAALLVLATGAVSQAQDLTVPPNSRQAARPQPPAAVNIKIQVVISRYQGDKKISSMPYMLGAVANSGKTSLRMGVDVPIAQTVFTSVSKDNPGVATPQASYSYRNVGTNIDCQAESAAGDYFKIMLTIADSSVQLETTERGKGVMPNVPMFRSFNSSFQVLLRDGQTTQYTSATDPVTGETTKVDVTLNVLK